MCEISIDDPYNFMKMYCETNLTHSLLKQTQHYGFEALILNMSLPAWSHITYHKIVMTYLYRR